MFDSHCVLADGSARRLLEEQGYEQEGQAFRLRQNGPLWVRMVKELALGSSQGD